MAAAGALSVLVAASPSRAEDEWFGPDKALHFGVSVGLAGGGYGVSALFLAPRTERAAVGAAFSLSLGAAKEFHDLAGHGDPSWRDFTWDVAGSAVGVGLGLLLDVLIAPGDTDSTSPARSR